MVFSQNVFKAGPHRFLRSTISSPAPLCCGDAEIAELVPSMAIKQDTSLQDSPDVVVMSKQLSIHGATATVALSRRLNKLIGRSLSLRNQCESATQQIKQSIYCNYIIMKLITALHLITLKYLQSMLFVFVCVRVCVRACVRACVREFISLKLFTKHVCRHLSTFSNSVVVGLCVFLNVRIAKATRWGILLNMIAAKRRKRNTGKHFSEIVLGSRPGTGVGVFGVKTTLTIMGCVSLVTRMITLISVTSY